MIVTWTPEAEQDRVDIWNYIVVDNLIAAVDMDICFSNAASSLAEQPEMGFLVRSLVVVNCFRIIIIVWCMKSMKTIVRYGYCL